MPGISESVISAEALEEAAKEVEKLLAADSQYAELSGKLRVTSHCELCNHNRLWLGYKFVTHGRYRAF